MNRGRALTFDSPAVARSPWLVVLVAVVSGLLAAAVILLAALTITYATQTAVTPRTGSTPPVARFTSSGVTATPSTSPAPTRTVSPRAPRRAATSPSRSRATSTPRITTTQFTCLHKLWDAESHWNPKAKNPTSSAAGIPQLLGMRTSTPAAEQVRIGLAYIAHRYGTPCAAWAFHQRNGWY